MSVCVLVTKSVHHDAESGAGAADVSLHRAGALIMPANMVEERPPPKVPSPAPSQETMHSFWLMPAIVRLTFLFSST